MAHKTIQSLKAYLLTGVLVTAPDCHYDLFGH